MEDNNAIAISQVGLSPVSGLMLMKQSIGLDTWLSPSQCCFLFAASFFRDVLQSERSFLSSIVYNLKLKHWQAESRDHLLHCSSSSQMSCAQSRALCAGSVISQLGICRTWEPSILLLTGSVSSDLVVSLQHTCQEFLVQGNLFIV